MGGAGSGAGEDLTLLGSGEADAAYVAGLAQDKRRLDRTKKLVWKEVDRRLAQHPEKIPEQPLYRMFLDILKLDEALTRKAMGDAQTERTKAVLSVVSDGLPRSRQIPLLVRAYHQLGAEEYRNALITLVGEDEAAKLLATEAA